MQIPEILILWDQDKIFSKGVCECKSGFAKALGRCIKTAWYSDCLESKWSGSFHAPIIYQDYTNLDHVPGGLFLNDGVAEGVQLTSGQCNIYRHEIAVVDWLRTRIKQATLQVAISKGSCDKVIFNGVANRCPVDSTLDLTSYLAFNPGSNAPSINDLRIMQTTNAFVEKMSYRFSIELKCAIGAEEINGACRCKDGYSVVDGECVQFTWVSRVETQVGDGEIEHSCYVPSAQSTWRLVPGSTFIWDQSITRVGTFRFSTLMPLDDWTRSHFDRATLDIYADDLFTIAFNGNVVKTITSRIPEITSYDVTEYMTNTTKPDLLEIHATNIEVNGGLSYKLVAHLKCPPNTVDKDGACVCPPGFGLINDVCTQGAWTSGPDTYLGEGKGTYPALATVRNTFENWMWHFSMSPEGTNRLYHKIVVPNAIKPKVTGATLYLNAGDSAKVIFNGQVVAERAAYSSQPYSYDVGQFLKLDATDSNPNLLEFWVSSSSSASVSGVYYKFVLRLNCGSNQVDVDGVCQCKFGYTSIAGVCYQAVWISDKTTKIGDAAKETSILLTSAPGSNVPGANWIWYQDPNKQGTFRFSEQIVLPSILRDKVTKVSITVSVDEYFRLIFNGETIVDKFSGLKTYDLTTKFKTAADAVNILEIYPTNTAGTGGLAYKFVVQTTCQPGAENIDGMCSCKQGYHAVGDTCLQTAWYSGCPQTEVSISLSNSILKTNPTTPVPMSKPITSGIARKNDYATFIDKIRLTSRVLGRMDRAELIIYSSPWNRIKFNDQSVTERSTDTTSTYDLTSMLLKPATDQLYAINELKIQVSKELNKENMLTYSFRIVQKCQPGAEDVRGACKCKWNFMTEGNTCVQRAWVSDLDALIGGDKHKPTLVNPTTNSQLITNAKWIWDGIASKSGTYDFYFIIQLPTALKNNLATVTLDISVDDYYRLVVNTNEITPKTGSNGMQPMKHDITSKIVFSDSPDQKNTLQMTVTNNANSQGGLNYKLTVHQTCPVGQKDIDGVCICTDGWVRLDGVCTQLDWSSSVSSMVGDGVNLKPAVAVFVSSAYTVGAQQIWSAADMTPGTFSFWEKFVVSDRFERDVLSALLQVTSDEYFRVVLNNQVIVDKETCNKCIPKMYDVSAFLLYSDKVYTQQNVLQITATSTDKFSCVSYKLTIGLARN